MVIISALTGFCIGMFFGTVISCIIIAKGKHDAYIDGYKDGLKVGGKNGGKKDVYSKNNRQ